MRLQLILPGIEPARVSLPDRCTDPTCDGTHFRLHQEVRKSLRDRLYESVPIYRYQCLRCGRTFRVYPKGVGNGQVSQRVKNLGVLLYLLGLSYREVSQTLGALGVYFCKSRVYDAVQDAAGQVIGFGRQPLFDAVRLASMTGDGPYVRWRGRWLPLDLNVHDIDGLVLTISQLSDEEAEALERTVVPVAAAIEAGVSSVMDVDVFRAVA
jgi:transposase-like protein